MTAPLDPLASTAASLVAGTAVGGQDQLAAWPGLVRLIALLHQTATGNPALHAALAAVAAAPEDPSRVAALAYAVDALAGDSGLRAELARLLDEARQHPTAGELVTQIGGHAQVGKLVTIGRAGTVHVHLPPPPPATVLDRLPPTRRGPVVANLPPRNPAFTGRADLLDQLHQRLHPGQAAAIVQVQAQTLHGLGGVGKTQLALEYAHRHQADYNLIWWITAELPAAIPGQLVALARRLGLPEQPEQAETVSALWDALRQRDRWLLVFDNAEDPADLRPWWPPDSGRVLVTSRHPTWAGPASALAVDVPPRTEAVAFLQHRLGRDDPEFNQLADTLGDLPLALEQAAAYLEETATTPSEYLALLATHARELFALGRPATTEETIATIWSVSLDRLRQQTPAAEDLLVLCAFLAPDDIPRSLPAQHPDALPERLAATVQAPLAYQQAIGALRRYSLITTSQDGEALSVHRLLQQVVRNSLEPATASGRAGAAVRLLAAVFPTKGFDDPGVWPQCAQLLPHAVAAADHAEHYQVEPAVTSDLLDSMAGYLHERARYAEARSLAQRALALAERTHGSESDIVAARLGSLAAVLRVQGELDHARILLERAVAIDEAHVGSDHPDTADSLHNLGLVLHAQGDLDGARTLHERALAILEAHLGADHPTIAAGLNHLADVVRAQGDLDYARSLFERALAIHEAYLGPDHPTTTWSLSNLARVLREQGDLDGARALQERALSVREALLGPDHPITAWSLHNLAGVLAAQGDLDRARTLFERALAIREARLGPDHYETARSLDNLAGVLAAQGDLDRARTLYERALAIREARLGPDHYETARSLNKLGAVLHAQGDLDGARTLYERALSIREARLGPGHPETAISLENLALVLAQDDLDAARPLFERALSIFEARLGPDHHETADSLTNLAEVLRDQGDLDGARTLYERALSIREARLGPDHPDTVRSRQRLAAVVAEMENCR